MYVDWADDARDAFLSFIDFLIEVSPASAEKAQLEVQTALSNLSVMPFMGHGSRWPGLRELLLPRWKNLLVYRVGPDGILIVALYDARQDLGKLTPEE